MKSTALRSATAIRVICLTLLAFVAVGASGMRRPVPTGARGAGAEYVLIEDELACRCVASPTVLERVPVLCGVDFLRTDSFTRREVPLLLSKPKNSMVRVTWRPLDLAEEGRIVAYSLLGYEYLQQDVRKGVTAVFIDTRQLLSGIYVVRLETLDGHPLGSARLVVEHPMQEQPRN